MTTRPPAAAAVAVVAALSLSSCTGGPHVEPNEAKQAVVAIVRTSTEALGGDWTNRGGGPGLGKCSGGVDWISIADGQASDDPAADVRTVQRLWDDRGMTTERYESGGADPILGVRGVGGPTATIEFNADPRGYTITGRSECAEGDFDEMQVGDD